MSDRYLGNYADMSALELLREARKWMNNAVGDSWAAHDRVNPPLFDAIDRALAAPAPTPTTSVEIPLSDNATVGWQRVTGRDANGDLCQGFIAVPPAGLSRADIADAIKAAPPGGVVRLPAGEGKAEDLSGAIADALGRPFNVKSCEPDAAGFYEWRGTDRTVTIAQTEPIMPSDATATTTAGPDDAVLTAVPGVSWLYEQLIATADAMTCYASTTTEYQPNAIAALMREAAAALKRASPLSLALDELVAARNAHNALLSDTKASKEAFIKSRDRMLTAWDSAQAVQNDGGIP